MSFVIDISRVVAVKRILTTELRELVTCAEDYANLFIFTIGN